LPRSGGIFAYILEEHSDSPSVHRYVLTKRGKQLAVVMPALWQWGEDNCFAGKLDYGLADEASGKMLARVELKTADGRRIDARELRMVVKKKKT
jgi:hypothetical protein